MNYTMSFLSIRRIILSSRVRPHYSHNSFLASFRFSRVYYSENGTLDSSEKPPSKCQTSSSSFSSFNAVNKLEGFSPGHGSSSTETHHDSKGFGKTKATTTSTLRTYSRSLSEESEVRYFPELTFGDGKVRRRERSKKRRSETRRKTNPRFAGGPTKHKRARDKSNHLYYQEGDFFRKKKGLEAFPLDGSCEASNRGSSTSTASSSCSSPGDRAEYQERVEVEGPGWSLERDVDPTTGESPMETVYSQEQLRYYKLLVCETGELPKEAYMDGSISPHFFVGFSHYDYRLRDVYRAIIAKQLSSMKDRVEGRSSGLCGSTSASSSTSSFPLTIGIQDVHLSVSWSGRFNPKLFHRVQRVCGVRLLLPSSSSFSDRDGLKNPVPHDGNQVKAGDVGGASLHKSSIHVNAADVSSRSTSRPHLHHTEEGKGVDDDPHRDSNNNNKKAESEAHADSGTSQKRGGTSHCASSASFSSTETTNSLPHSFCSLPECWRARVRHFVKRINRHEDQELLSLRFFQASEAISEVEFESSSLGTSDTLSSRDDDKQQKDKKKAGLQRALLFLLRAVLERRILRAHVGVIVLGNEEVWRSIWLVPGEVSSGSLPPSDVKKTGFPSSIRTSSPCVDKTNTLLSTISECREGKCSRGEDILWKRRMSALKMESDGIEAQKRKFLYQKDSWFKLFHTRQVIPRVVSLTSLAVLAAVEVLQHRSRGGGVKEKDRDGGETIPSTTGHKEDKGKGPESAPHSPSYFGSFVASIFSMLEPPLQAFIEDLAAAAAGALQKKGKGRYEGEGSGRSFWTSAASGIEEEGTCGEGKIDSNILKGEERKESLSAWDGQQLFMEEDGGAALHEVEDEEFVLRNLFARVAHSKGRHPSSAVATPSGSFAASSTPCHLSDGASGGVDEDEANLHVAAAFTWLEWMYISLSQCVHGTVGRYSDGTRHFTQGNANAALREKTSAVGEESLSHRMELPFPFFFLHGAYGGTIPEVEYLKRNKIAADAAILHPSHTSIKNVLRSKQEKNRRRALALGIPASRKREDFIRRHRRPALLEEMNAMDHHRSSP